MGEAGFFWTLTGFHSEQGTKEKCVASSLLTGYIHSVNVYPVPATCHTLCGRRVMVLALMEFAG